MCIIVCCLRHKKEVLTSILSADILATTIKNFAPEKYCLDYILESSI